jgi:hypothetical protein
MICSFLHQRHIAIDLDAFAADPSTIYCPGLREEPQYQFQPGGFASAIRPDNGYKVPCGIIKSHP